MTVIRDAALKNVSFGYQYDPSSNSLQPNELRVAVSVSDTKLRKRLPGFNGLEQAFALVPRYSGQGVQWDRVPLKYEGSGYGMVDPVKGETLDQHAVTLRQFDAKAVRELGVAFGFDTNCGTVYPQGPGEDTKAKE